MKTIIGKVDYWEYVIACCLEWWLYQTGKLSRDEVNETLLFDFYMNDDCF